MGGVSLAAVLCLSPLLGGFGTASRATPKTPPVTDGERFGVIHEVEGW